MIPIIITASVPQFDLSLLHKRDLVRAQYKDWEEPRNGLLVNAQTDELTVLFLPGVGVATSYYTVRADEVAAGDWPLLISTSDLATFCGGVT